MLCTPAIWSTSPASPPTAEHRTGPLPGKGLCFNFQGEVCVASLFFLPLCACAHTHNTHMHPALSCVHLCFTDWLFTFSYGTGESFTAPQPLLEHQRKLHCSFLDSLIPSCDPPAWLEDLGALQELSVGCKMWSQGAHSLPRPNVVPGLVT